MGIRADELITARELLRRFMELRLLTPDLNDWTEERLGKNEPRIIRLKRLMAIFAAFGIAWDPESFTKGSFIKGESPAYASLIARAKRELPASLSKHKHFPPGPNHQLSGAFEILLSYREQLGKVLSFLSGVSCSHGMYMYADRQIERLNQVIEDNVGIVDDVLAEFVCPDKREFTVAQLARDYGYPDVDLFEIDSDYF